MQKNFSILMIIIFAFMFGLQSEAKANAQEKYTCIEDDYQFFSEEEVQKIIDEVKKLPESYKIIVLPTIQGSIENSAKTLFQHRKLSQDTILILLLTDDKKIFATTGKSLQKKGLDDLFFQQEIETYFLPSAKNKPVVEALIDLLHGVSKDIPKYIVKEKNSPKLPPPPESKTLTNSANEIDSEEYNYITYIGLSALVILGFILFRKVYIKK